MGKRALQSKANLEREILAHRSYDFSIAFKELFLLYAQDIFSYCYVGLYHHTKLAEEVTTLVFYKAHQYFHKVEFTRGSYRTYLFAIAVPLVVKERANLQTEHRNVLRFLNKRISNVERDTWHALQQLDPMTFTIVDLWQGAQLHPMDIALATQFTEHEVMRRHQSVQERWGDISKLYSKRERFIPWNNTMERRIYQRATTQRKHSPTFVHPSWWANIFGPIPSGFMLGLVCVTASALWYSYTPQPLVTAETVAPPPAIIVQPTVTQRPSDVSVDQSLPTVHIAKRSLTEVTETLYGTNYVAQRELTNSDSEEVRPTIEVNLPVNEYKKVEAARVYATPETLEKDKLQIKAYQHFYSLPLNQFTYANNTYYLEESSTEFRPLFIAFNGDGSVEYQMRKAAICDVDTLTEPVDEEKARQTAYDFLKSHNFVTEEQATLKIERLSEQGRTIPKDAFCADGDTTPVSDYEFVFFLPHREIRYDNGSSDHLPIRLRGIAVQVQGNTITNMRIDQFYNLYDNIVQTEYPELKTLEEAIAMAKDFYYPASDATEEYQRYQRAFMQWDHQHAEERLEQITLNHVRLEYVYDSLNHLVEPYYVFSGTGQDANSEDDSVRLYVAASIQDIELRSPYRE